MRGMTHMMATRIATDPEAGPAGRGRGGRRNHWGRRIRGVLRRRRG